MPSHPDSNLYKHFMSSHTIAAIMTNRPVDDVLSSFLFDDIVYPCDGRFVVVWQEFDESVEVLDTMTSTLCNT